MEPKPLLLLSQKSQLDHILSQFSPVNTITFFFLKLLFSRIHSAIYALVISNLDFA